MPIAWEDPPRSERPSRRIDFYKEYLQPLTHRRNKWALIEILDTKGKAISFYTCVMSFEGFEATQRKIDDNVYRIYARYIG